jgi:hypothetical protein
MKLYLLLGLTVIVISCCRMAFKKTNTATGSAKTDLREYAGALYAVKKNGKWGYLNNNLEMAIPAQFHHAEEFNEGMASVSGLVNNGNGEPKELYGSIDTTGKLIVAFKYDKIYDFSEGMAAVVKNGKYGYIDKTGTELVPPQYEDGSSFSEGLAVVKEHGKNGFIDRSGRMVIQPKFSRACWVSVFSEGLAPVYLPDDSAGYIDSTGNFIVPPNFSYVSAFSEGLALVQPKGSYKYGYINRKGEMVIEPIYELSLPFTEGVATVKMTGANGKSFFRIIDKQGRIIADHLQYSFAGIFREGLAGVESYDHRWGFIDRNGKEVIAPRFSSVRLFRNGLSMIQTGSLFTELQTGYIDKEGNILVGTQK